MEQLAETIRQSYSINVLGIEKIKNAYRVKTSEGTKCFKSSTYDLRQYSFIMRVLSYLESKEYPHLPARCKTTEGRSYIGFENKYGFLCDWVDSREADFGNPIELRLCLESLALLHTTSQGFSFQDTSSVRYLYGKWVHRFRKRCDELLYFKALIINKDKKTFTEFDNRYLQLFERHYRQGIKTVHDLEKSSYYKVMDKHQASSCVCHHDTANHNFLVTSGLEIFLIDFDYCIYDTFLHDLASILLRNLKYGNWCMSKLEYILNCYCGCRPLSNEELETMFCIMQFPQDFWQLGLQYYIENKIWSEEVFLKKLHRISADLAERNEFLATLDGRWRHACNQI